MKSVQRIHILLRYIYFMLLHEADDKYVLPEEGEGKGDQGMMLTKRIVTARVRWN